MKQALTKEQKESIELWISDGTSLELSSDPKVRGLQIDHALFVLRGYCAVLSASKRAVYMLEQAERLNKILSTKRNKD